MPTTETTDTTGAEQGRSVPDHGIARLTSPVGERDHAQGPADALVTLVEYGDYECPYCRAAVPIVRELQGLLGDQLRYVFRHFPITRSHTHAQHAAEAAEGAAAQGRFFEMHAALFEHQEALQDDDLVRYAADLDIAPAGIRRELRAHTHAARVREDLESGLSSGARGTPTFYLDEIRYDGIVGVRQFLAAIQDAHPEIVIDETNERVGQRTIPRVVEQRSPLRPSDG
jgi:protein-disulfide isomerase